MQMLQQEQCHNVLVVAITPRNGERGIDLAGIDRNVRFLCEQGVDFRSEERRVGKEGRSRGSPYH